jgi:Ca-activated chloride channel family protein
MLKRIYVLLYLFLLTSLAHAQRQAPLPLIDTPHGAQPIVLQSLSIRSDISGSMATTTVNMVFYNPNARQLEGTLQFPLLAHQQIDAFALDINGVMRPAVPVEKAKGRAVFDAIERRQVDPALLEVTEGNNFKLRIYPILPRSTRTVELRYTEGLQRKNQQWTYRLPLGYGPVQQFELDMAVHGTQMPQPAGKGLAGLTFVRSGDGWQARHAQQDGKADGMVEVALAASGEPQVFRQSFQGEQWFVAEIPVVTGGTPRIPPKTIGLLWDSSDSGARRNIAAELAQLDRLFAALGTVEVRLQRLRDRPESSRVFHVVDGNWAALRTALESTVYDGASALNDWTRQADVHDYLLFSDGLANYGSQRSHALMQGQRLYAVNSALSADRNRLAAMAERHGGMLVEASSDAPDALLDALRTDRTRIVSMSATGASDLEIESHSERNGLLRVAGRLTAPEAQLKLVITAGARRDLRQVSIDANTPVHPLAAATWAGFRLRALEADFEANRAQIKRIGREFGLVTRETSLIVLDTVDDYLRYDIEPPAILAAEYHKRRKARDSEQARVQRDHLEEVVRMFEQRTAWWNTTFPKPLPKPVRRDNRAVAPLMESGVVMLHTPAPAMAMAPMARNKSAVDAFDSNDKQDARPIGIALKKWTSNAPYIKRLRKAAADKVYAVYLDERRGYANSSAFYLDAADILFDKGLRDLGLRVLSNLAEMDLENRALLRILGYRLQQAGEARLALPVFEKVLTLAAEEPQSLRDLGLAHAAAGNEQAAIDRLYDVVERKWDARFPQIETIVLAEMNAIIARSTKPLNVKRIDRRLRANLPLDLRVIMTWDADNTDIDMWVTDPQGEKSFYGNGLSQQGARMSPDFTGGYGPEEFSLRLARPGKYRVEANYYGNQQQVLAGATTLQLKLFTRFGTRDQKEQLTTLRLKDNSETVFVGEFEVGR